MRKIPKIFQNFFVVTSLVFGTWILFLDSNDLITQYKRQQKTKQLKKEKKYYEQQIKRIEKGYQELLDNPRKLEKLAREKYFLKKDTHHNEDFVKKAYGSNCLINQKLFNNFFCSQILNLSKILNADFWYSFMK